MTTKILLKKIGLNVVHSDAPIDLPLTSKPPHSYPNSAIVAGCPLAGRQVIALKVDKWQVNMIEEGIRGCVTNT